MANVRIKDLTTATPTGAEYAPFDSASGGTRKATIRDTVTAIAVVAVSGTSPIVAAGTSTSTISILTASTSNPGSMSAADKTKLDSLTVGADNTFAYLTGASGVVPFGSGSTFTLVVGNNINSNAIFSGNAAFVSPVSVSGTTTFANTATFNARVVHQNTTLLSGAVEFDSFALFSGTVEFYSTATFDARTIFKAVNIFSGNTEFYNTATFEQRAYFSATVVISGAAEFDSRTVFSGGVEFYNTATFDQKTIFSGLGIFSAGLFANNQLLSGVKDPIDFQDASTKLYVDYIPVRLVTVNSATVATTDFGGAIAFNYTGSVVVTVPNLTSSFPSNKLTTLLFQVEQTGTALSIIPTSSAKINFLTSAWAPTTGSGVWAMSTRDGLNWWHS